MERKDLPAIPQEQFKFTQLDEAIHDQKFETKSISYFQDALTRFSKNKASVVAFWIIVIIVIFAIFGPLLSNYEMSFADGNYARCKPKLQIFDRNGSGFWDGSQTMKYNDNYFLYAAAIGMGANSKNSDDIVSWEQGMESPFQPIISYSEPYMGGGKRYRDALVDSYYLVGFKYLTLRESEFEDLKKWEKETGIQVLYPMVDMKSEYFYEGNSQDANYWFNHAPNGKPLDANGKKMSLEDVQEKGLVPNYAHDADGNIKYYQPRGRSMKDVRVLYYNYFIYKNGFAPAYVFGADGQGYDILVRMASGTRLSLILSVCVSFVNLTFGAIYGAIEGFYGGWVDMLLERIADIIAGIPFLVTATLFQLHLVQTGKVSTFVGLLFAFCLTGWIGTAYRVRTQFYRFKKQEYVLAAKTLGAKDRRLMFKHIFPNAIGTIITSSVLVIPGTIMSETSLAYLGIVNFNSKDMTSLGTLLGNGQGYLGTDPHILFFPAVIISLLMISFNLFGNGLRDAFNPSLRGADE